MRKKKTASGKQLFASQESKTAAWLNIQNLILFFVFTSVITSVKLFLDDGVFWHLSTGRYILENKAIPASDVFGFMSFGTKWIPFEWGWDVLTYLVWKTGGWILLSLLRTTLFAVLFIPPFLLFRQMKVSPLIYIPAAILLCVGLMSRLSIRPHLVTYLFLSLLTSFLLYYKLSEHKPRRLLYLLPALFVLWTNIHPGVLLGAMILGCYTCAEAAEFVWNKYHSNSGKKTDTAELRTVLSASMLTFAGMLLNPSGIETFIYSYNHTQMESLSGISEWLSPFDSRISGFYYIKIYIIFLCLSIPVLFYCIKSGNIFAFVLTIASVIFSFGAQRYTSDFMVIAYIPGVLSLSYFAKKLYINSSLNNAFGTASRLVLSICIIYLVYISVNNSLYKNLNNQFRETGFGINENYYPVKLFDFIKKENIHQTGQRPFNNIKIGGFFLWNFPGKMNFIDSRNLSDNVMKNYFTVNLMKDGFEKKLAEYDIDYVIYSLPYMTTNPNEMKQNIIFYLSQSSEWRLLYWDDRSFLFVRNEPKFASLIEKYGYRFVTPYNLYFRQEVLSAAVKNNRNDIMKEMHRKASEESEGIVYRQLKQKLDWYISAR